MARSSPTWSNWSRTVTCAPAVTFRPRDVAEIVNAVKHAEQTGRRLRPRGAGHSSTALAATGDVVVDLSGWAGVQGADLATGTVTVRSGTPLHRLNAALDDLGLALTNLGDIDRQTIAGAISTGTHGTGRRIGGMPTQVREIEMVLADGTVTTCSDRHRPDLFAAARVGLGALGVITTVTLQCEPAFALAAEEYPEPVEHMMERFPQYASDNDHLDLYWFPYSRQGIVKRYNRLPPGTPVAPLGGIRRWFERDLTENTAFGLVCRTARALPHTTGRLSRACSALTSHLSYSDRSYRVLTTRRRVRFVECEYALPFGALRHVFDALRTAVPRLRHPVMFPVEVRVSAADDIWLSPAYGRETVYVSAQQFAGMPYHEYFDVFESIAVEAGGRPHWGKVHTRTLETLRDRFPRMNDFRRVRAEVDPQGRFHNAHLDRVLGRSAEL